MANTTDLQKSTLTSFAPDRTWQNDAASSGLPDGVESFTVDELKAAGFKISNRVRRTNKKVLKAGKVVIKDGKPLTEKGAKYLLVMQPGQRPLPVFFSQPLSELHEEDDTLTADQISILIFPAGFKFNSGNTIEHDVMLIGRSGSVEWM